MSYFTPYSKCCNNKYISTSTTNAWFFSSFFGKQKEHLLIHGVFWNPEISPLSKNISHFCSLQEGAFRSSFHGNHQDRRTYTGSLTPLPRSHSASRDTALVCEMYRIIYMIKVCFNTFIAKMCCNAYITKMYFNTYITKMYYNDYNTKDCCNTLNLYY